MLTEEWGLVGSGKEGGGERERGKGGGERGREGKREIVVCEGGSQGYGAGFTVMEVMDNDQGCTNLASELGQISPKWDKSGTF